MIWPRTDSYDPNSNLLTITDAEGGVTDYTYDPRNLKTATQYPDHAAGTSPGDPDYGIVEMAYDAARRHRRKTDQLGETVRYNYDMANRLLSRDYRTRPNSPGGAIADSDSFTYDDASRLLTADSGRYNNDLAFTYNDDSTLASEALTTNGQTYTVQHAYDGADRMVTCTYPDGSVVTRAYTDRNQLSDVDYDADGGGMMVATDVAAFSYDAAMRETQRDHGNGLQTTRTYNRADNLVTDITAETAPGAGDRPGLSFAYTYDENKNVTAETTGGVMNGYSFTTNQDAKDRLIDWTRTNGDTQDWDFTLVGDWDQFTENIGGGPGGGTTADRTHNDAHEINNISGGPNNGTLAHDAKGNLTHEGNDTVQRYTYDFDNQLNSVDENQDGTSEIQYTYDALGRRVTKTVGGGGGTTVYVCETHGGMPGSRGSMGKVIAEYEGGTAAGNPVQKYVHGTYVDEPLMLITIDATTGVETNHFYHQNCINTITALTDSTGTVEERYAYTPYGKQTILDPVGGVRTSSMIDQTKNVLGHQGLMHDQETRLIYNRARMLHPRLGRFMQRDPIGYWAGSMSLYQYVRSNPLYWLDPAGLRGLEKDLEERRVRKAAENRERQREKFDRRRARNRSARKRRLAEEGDPRAYDNEFFEPASNPHMTPEEAGDAAVRGIEDRGQNIDTSCDDWNGFQNCIKATSHAMAPVNPFGNCAKACGICAAWPGPLFSKGIACAPCVACGAALGGTVASCYCQHC